MTRKELAEQIGLSQDGIKYHLEKVEGGNRGMSVMQSKGFRVDKALRSHQRCSLPERVDTHSAHQELEFMAKVHAE